MEHALAHARRPRAAGRRDGRPAGAPAAAQPQACVRAHGLRVSRKALPCAGRSAAAQHATTLGWKEAALGPQGRLRDCLLPCLTGAPHLQMFAGRAWRWGPCLPACMMRCGARNRPWSAAAQPDNTLSPLGWAVLLVDTHMRGGDLVQSDSQAWVRTWVRHRAGRPWSGRARSGGFSSMQTLPCFGGSAEPGIPHPRPARAPTRAPGPARQLGRRGAAGGQSCCTRRRSAPLC